MAQEKHTLGQAIDRVVEALEPLDEAARNTALIAVCAHLKIELVLPSGRRTPLVPLSGANPIAPALQDVEPTPLNPAPARVDIRALKAAKQPKNAQQMACLVAYYLQELAPETERKDSISSADLDKYFKQAGFKLPQRLQQVLPDGKSSGYFDSAGRGDYKLNAVGYNLVVHNLPGGGTAAR